MSPLCLTQCQQECSHNECPSKLPPHKPIINNFSGGERVTTFQLSKSGNYVTYFYLKTSRNQEVKQDAGEGGPIISSDVGSGMICG